MNPDLLSRFSYISCINQLKPNSSHVQPAIKDLLNQLAFDLVKRGIKKPSKRQPQVVALFDEKSHINVATKLCLN